MLEQMRNAFDLNAMVCRKMDEKIRRLDDNLAPGVDVARGCIVNPLFKTNADKIRDMTNEELLTFLVKHDVEQNRMRLVSNGIVPTATQLSVLSNTLQAVWGNWLRQPAEES
jgi:hypothetical protein